MFRGYGESVEENQEDDQPIENLRLDRRSALPPKQPVPPARVPTEEEGAEVVTGDEVRRDRRDEVEKSKDRLSAERQMRKERKKKSKGT